MEQNYYELLWLTKSATQDEIKKAYRKKAMEHHPDRWGDAEEFKKINEAYSILSDENKKREYDTYWRVWGWNPFWWNWFWWFSWWVDIDLWDIFESMFGWWNRSNRSRKQNQWWEDLEFILNIDLKTSVLGWKTTINYEKLIFCDLCNWEWWKWKKRCSECNWSWHVKYRQKTIFWVMEQTVVCENCHWTWETIEKLCEKCNWAKRIKKSVDYEFEIPPWIDEWMVIKINWEWNHWSTNGDLYIKFKVNSIDKNLKRKWSNLYYDLEIDVIEAILWTQKEINIPVIWKRNIIIESGTQVWTTIKINWDGVKYIDKDKKWDLYINIIIKIPKKLSENERNLYEQIAKDNKLNVHNKKWIFEKLFG